MAKKYEFTGDAHPNFKSLWRIRALVDIPRHNVKAGDLGGWIDAYRCLSHTGDCWVGEEAVVFMNATVKGNALVKGNATVSHYAQVLDDAMVGQHALVVGHSKVMGHSAVIGEARVLACACVQGKAQVRARATIEGKAIIKDFASIYGYAVCKGSVTICGNSIISRGMHDKGTLCGKVMLSSTKVSERAVEENTLILTSDEALSEALLNDTK